MWSKADIEFSNGQAKNYIKSLLSRAESLQQDSSKEDRLKKGECKSCYYILSKIGGAAITKSNCKICDRDIINSSTCVNTLCTNCSKENNLCRHCGADMSLRLSKSYDYLKDKYEK